MIELVARVQARYPGLHFTPTNTFYWSPETNEVFYDASTDEPQHVWALLHETGHALLGHTSYKADIELIKLEVVAWEKAQELAAQFDIRIDEDHIQDCLDTYRDWIYQRSICPTCTTKALQQSDFAHYRCQNCHTVWKVTPSRFARPYRAVKSVKAPTLVFHATESL